MTDDAITIREALEADVEPIRQVFIAVYGHDYPYRRFYDPEWLKRSIFSDDILTLVAELDGEIVGTASVVYSAGARSDFVGEFGRLVVHPDARGHHVGTRLMQGRIEFARQRLHAGIVENRTAHTFSQQIAEHHGFAPVGFLPLKHCFVHGERESIAMYVRHFGPALELRRANPRVVPEAHSLAFQALQACGLPDDVIVDGQSSAYPGSKAFDVETFESDKMAPLLRIERGRVHQREVYGPIRLHYGFFKLADRNASYLVARDGEDGPLAGAIGYLHDEWERSIRVFELIARSDDAPRFLIEALLDEAREWGVEYLEIDVNAHAPRMQRTLIELGFHPAAYIPALVFDRVDRVDIVKMIRLMVRPDIGQPALTPDAQAYADLVMQPFREQTVLPRIEEAMDRVALFDDLDVEQRRAVGALGELARIREGETLFTEGESAQRMYLTLEGRIGIRSGGERVGVVEAGEPLGEVALLAGNMHSADAIAVTDGLIATIEKSDLEALVRRRPDVGVVIYRNLAIALGKKLRRADQSLVDAPS